MNLFLDYRAAVIALLRGDPALTAKVPAARIVEVPADTLAYPHVWLEDNGAEDWSTKTENGVQCELALHIGSRYNGTKEILEIAGRVHALLHFATLTLAEGQCVVSVFDRSNILLDQDGVTRHGVLRFQFTNSEG